MRILSVCVCVCTSVCVCSPTVLPRQMSQYGVFARAQSPWSQTQAAAAAAAAVSAPQYCNRDITSH